MYPVTESTPAWMAFGAVAAAAGLLWFPTHRTIHALLSSRGLLDTLKTARAKNKVVSTTMSTLHAVVLLVVAEYAVGSALQTGPVVSSSTEAYAGYMGFLTQFTAGYFLHDTANQLVFNWGSPDLGQMLAHHGFFLAGCSLLLHYRVGAWLPMLWSLTEVSTPFVNNRFIMVELGMKSSPYYTYNGIAILATFTLRVIVSWYIIYLLAFHSHLLATAAPPLYYIQGAASLLMTGLNMLWYSKILRMSYYALSNRGKEGKPVENSKIRLGARGPIAPSLAALKAKSD